MKPGRVSKEQTEITEGHEERAQRREEIKKSDLSVPCSCRKAAFRQGSVVFMCLGQAGESRGETPAAGAMMN